MTTLIPVAETHEQHIARLERRAERERITRNEAERLLEIKSRELFNSNRALEAAVKAQVQTSNQLLSILDNIPIAVIFANPEGQVEWCNAMALKLFGVEVEEAKARTVNDFLPQLTNPELMSMVMTSAASDTLTSGRRADGTEFPAEISFTVVESQTGTSMIWMVRDITHRVTAEERRRELEAELRRAQRLESLGTLAGGMAHELNTPIQFITDNANFLLGAFKDFGDAIDDFQVAAPEQADNIFAKHDLTYLKKEIPDAINQSLEGLTRVAEIVLAIKRFSYPTTAAMEENDLNQIVQTTVLVSKNQWKYLAELELNLANDLPRVKSNAGELNQVLLNLIVNAAHAIEEKGIDNGPGKIKISTQAVDGGVECSIQDSGAGIKPEIKDKIFDLFFTTKAPGRGTGQGLALVHSIVTQSHGGRIVVESTVGHGTTFSFWLPTSS